MANTWCIIFEEKCVFYPVDYEPALNVLQTTVNIFKDLRYRCTSVRIIKVISLQLESVISQ